MQDDDASCNVENRDTSDKKNRLNYHMWHVWQVKFGLQPALHKAKLHFTLRNYFGDATSISSVHALPGVVPRYTTPKNVNNCKKRYAKQDCLSMSAAFSETLV